jgi:antitoxin component of MazEF toxin-antitoxin module
MATVTVGKWGKSLAVRVPAAVAETIGLAAGEIVEIEAIRGDLMIHRSATRTEVRHRAEAAAAEIEIESKRYHLGGACIRGLLEKGRNG